MGFLAAECSETPNPVGPSQVAEARATSQVGGHSGHVTPAQSEDKGYINGWFDGGDVQLAAWNEIAAAKTLAKVRELQGGNPNVGVPGVISADTSTNIYFFIAGLRPEH